MEVIVLRYGHRHVRDERVTSHCCLVARAFGAKKIIIEGEEDEQITNTVMEISKKWGQGFSLEFTQSWEKTLDKYKKNGFKSIHLTMYGIPLKKKRSKLSSIKKLVVIIGSQKVEPKVYESADYNISITNQPHSEIAALAVFLYSMLPEKKFQKHEIKIIPAERGKKVIKNKG